MFLPGTKVEIVASSDTGKGTKLRRGSLGYVSSQGSVHTMHKLGLFVMPARLVVTRFGNESGRRIEHKWVQFILPLGPPSKHPIHKLNTILQKSQDANQVTKLYFENEGVKIKRVPSLVAIPTTQESNYSESIDELKAWISSLLFSGHLHHTFFGQHPTPETIQKTKLWEVLPELAEDLHSLVSHPKTLYKLLDGFNKNKDYSALANAVIWFRTQQMLLVKKILHEKYKISSPMYLNIEDTASLAWIKYGLGTKVNIRSTSSTKALQSWAELLKFI